MKTLLPTLLLILSFSGGIGVGRYYFPYIPPPIEDDNTVPFPKIEYAKDMKGFIEFGEWEISKDRRFIETEIKNISDSQLHDFAINGTAYDARGRTLGSVMTLYPKLQPNEVGILQSTLKSSNTRKIIFSRERP